MAHWIRKTHLFRRDEYICSNCGFRSAKPYVECPNCDEPMGRTRNDPNWVDELEEIDAMLDD